MAEYLVTGGAGFIGSHIAGELVKQGKSIRIIDNLSTGRYENILSFKDSIEFIEADFSDLDTAREAVRGITYVLHQGALPSVARSVDDPVSSNKSNITGTLNLLISARDAGVRRFIYASSSSVYGDSQELPKREAMPVNPLSPYALTKLAGEYYCRLFHSLYGLETISLRYFNVYGPRQNSKSKYSAVIPAFISALLKGERTTIDGDGEQTRCFTYVEDVVRANILGCSAPDSSLGGVFNIAGNERTSINHLFRLLRNITGSSEEPVYGPPREGDVRYSWSDCSSAERHLKFRAEIALADGLRKTIEWFEKFYNK